MSVGPGNTSSNSNVREHFFRQFKREETSLQEQMTHLKEIALQPAERASITDRCLAIISQLSNEVKDASAYLPVYDQRTYSTAVKSLNENLQEIRNASAPKRKFAFKRTVAQKKLADSGNDHGQDASLHDLAATGDSAKINSSYEPDHDSLDVGLVSETSGAAITITSLSSAYHRFDSTPTKPGSSISITKIHHSAVDLSDSLSRPCATLVIKSVTESLLICGRTSGAAHITGVQNSTLVLWSRQVRMHECKDCLVYLRCGSRPIIEDCTGIRFVTFPPIYVSIPFTASELFSSIIWDQDTTETSRPDSPNMWDQVDDFTWLRAEHSPNWRTLQPGDKGTIEGGPWEVIKGCDSTECTLSELDDLLRAAKVI